MLWLAWGAVTVALLCFCYLINKLLDVIDERRRYR